MVTHDNELFSLIQYKNVFFSSKHVQLENMIFLNIYSLLIFKGIFGNLIIVCYFQLLFFFLFKFLLKKIKFLNPKLDP